MHKRVLSILWAIKNEDVTLFCALLPRKREYLKKFDDSDTMSFLVEDRKYLKNAMKYGTKF